MKRMILALLSSVIALSVYALPCQPEQANGDGINYRVTRIQGDVIASWWCPNSKGDYEPYALVAKQADKPKLISVLTPAGVELGKELLRLDVLFGYAIDSSTYRKVELGKQLRESVPGRKGPKA